MLNDLVVAVQGIRLYLAGPYGPPPPLHPAASAGQQALPWYSVPAATTGGYPSLSPPAASTPPWLQWPTPFAAPTAPPATTQGPQWPTWAPPPAPSPTAPSFPAATVQVPPPPPPNPSLGRSSPSGLPIQEVRFPSSSSPLPGWLHGPLSASTEARPPSGFQLQPEVSGATGDYAGPSTQDRAPSSALTPKSWGWRGHSIPHGRRSSHDMALLPLSPHITLGRQSPAPHDGRSLRPAGCGPYRAVTSQKMVQAEPDGPEEGRPLAGGRPLPRGPCTINLMRPGVATVISHQAAGTVATMR